jgi:chemotaxis protein histidine kinase CheA
MNVTPEQRAAAARARMSELAEKFLERTRREVLTLRERFVQLGGGDAGALDEIVHLSHRMTGTGATLGFDSLSDFAQRVEKLAGAGVVPDAPALARLGAAIDALAAEVERVASSRGGG